MEKFIKAMLIRALRTMAQTAIASIGCVSLLSQIDFKLVLSTTVLAGMLSILTSIATGLPEVDKNGDNN